MTAAVVTDIHGNLAALQAALDRIDELLDDCGCAYVDQHDRELGHERLAAAENADKLLVAA